MALSEVERTERKVNKLDGHKDVLRDRLKKAKRKRRGEKRKGKRLEKALIIAQTVGQQTQEEIQYRISGIVTNALESVFPEPYEFHIHFEIKRGKTEARMVFQKDGEDIDPLTASGGGVVDVASFALRIACFLIMRPRSRPFLVMDEPFRFVSKNYMEQVADLLQEISERLDIQFLIVTHEKELQAGNIIDINDLRKENDE